jgi:hypothetical protein
MTDFVIIVSVFCLRLAHHGLQGSGLFVCNTCVVWYGVTNILEELTASNTANQKLQGIMSKPSRP